MPPQFVLHPRVIISVLSQFFRRALNPLSKNLEGLALAVGLDLIVNQLLPVENHVMWQKTAASRPARRDSTQQLYRRESFEDRVHPFVPASDAA